MGWVTKKSGFDSYQEQICSLHQSVQNGFEAQPASYPVGTGNSFSGHKHEADHSPPSTRSTDIRLRGAIPSLFMAQRLINK
jgi:hypothetical protein